MNAETYIFAANAAVWLGIAGYCIYLALSQRQLSRRLDRLEHMQEDEHNG